MIEHHKKALQEAREQAAEEAMTRLADVLLGLKPVDELVKSTIPSPRQPKTPEPPPSSRKEKAKSPPKKKRPPNETKYETVTAESVTPAPKVTPKTEDHEDDDLQISVGEAWIETALCTTCNECTNLNNQIFKYNEEKQAYVADPKAGTFAEIVQAAELCPAGIIHPGAPQHPNEPGLEALIKRATPFNAE